MFLIFLIIEKLNIIGKSKLNTGVFASLKPGSILFDKVLQP